MTVQEDLDRARADLARMRPEPCSSKPKRRLPKPRPWVIRLEWASTISYCDVHVIARTAAGAIKRAYEDCDYENQDTYDEGGETYVSAIAPVRTVEGAERIIDNNDTWDVGGNGPIPAKHRSPEYQAQAWKERALFLKGGLQRLRDHLTEIAPQTTGDLAARLENDLRLADYLLSDTVR